MLEDRYGRVINYLRLAVTDRCNLRCFYCMPAEGIDYVRRKELMSYEEMVKLVTLLVELGVTKLRITGGEPFLRKDLMDFLRMVSKTSLSEIHITTNGTLTYDHVPELKELGIASVNLSLDTLDADRFHNITRRNDFEKVHATLFRLLDYEIETKVNMVVMPGQNLQDIVAMAELARNNPVTVRYIEEMPFNGQGKSDKNEWVDYRAIEQILKNAYPDMEVKPATKSATASRISIPGFKGRLGVIAAFSRTFCGACNRLRITPKGVVRTCLYDEGVFNVLKLLRHGATDHQIKEAMIAAVKEKAENGFVAEKNRWSNVSESMSTIGG